MNIKHLQNSKVPVLILGETGTGKTEMAKRLGTKHSPFIHLNIASINKNIFESELFGHKKGAFSGAVENKSGFCESAGSGTLFFDEIGDLSLELQAKLLTLLDEKIFYSVGCTKQKIFRGRIICATHKNLKEMIKQGRFREDLYFRLRFFQIEKKPLRRQDNLRNIILEGINNLQVKYKKPLLFKTMTLNQLIKYQWPGNYRELEQTLEMLFISIDRIVEPNDLPEWILENQVEEIEPNNDEKRYQDALENFEVDYFKELLKANDGKINLSSQVAGISKVTLISKLKKYGINRLLYKKQLNAIAG